MPVSATQAPLRLHMRTVPPPANLLGLRRAVANCSHGVMLESIAGGRYSYYATQPVRVIQTTWDDPVDAFGLLARHATPWHPILDSPEIPFLAGWIGYFSYECGRFVEPRGGWYRQRQAFPLARWVLFDTVLIHDRLRSVWTIATVDLPQHMHAWPRPPGRERLLAMERFLAGTEDQSTDDPQDPSTDAMSPEGSVPISSDIGTWEWTPREYARRVERAIEYIRAGDIFQANLSLRYRTRTTTAPVDLYHHLCASNPASFAAYLNVPALAKGGAFDRDSRSLSSPEKVSGRLSGGAILSSSPELFLDLRGGAVTTRPIKGTRPRAGDPTRDLDARRELATSEKERAELNMIIDLERNDLGRVCEYGTVLVEDDGEIEAHPTVFHRTATITGRLRRGRDAIDLLRATFPGGSITGAPKVRATQIIHELEAAPRGPYCGAIGWIGVNGDMCLNIAIRTITVADESVELRVGSGIVADSDPDAEYHETQAKAAGMMRALHGNGESRFANGALDSAPAHPAVTV